MIVAYVNGLDICLQSKWYVFMVRSHFKYEQQVWVLTESYSGALIQITHGSETCRRSDSGVGGQLTAFTFKLKLSRFR